MPNIKSAKKRVKVNTTKAAANKARKSNLKTVIKNADAERTPEAIKVAIKKVDQACSKGRMHKNKAARKKSQLAKKLNAANSLMLIKQISCKSLTACRRIFLFMHRTRSFDGFKNNALIVTVILIHYRACMQFSRSLG